MSIRKTNFLKRSVGPPKICFISPNNYSLFNPIFSSHFGGWEVRIALIAKELARRGHLTVCLLVGDYGQAEKEQRFGVTLYSWKNRQFWGIPYPAPSSPESGWSKLWRKASSRIPLRRRPLIEEAQIGGYRIDPSLLQILDDIDAQVYIVPGNSQISGEAAYYCQQRGRPYVFLAGSDIDFDPAYKTEPTQLDIYSVPYALKAFSIQQASLHILQNSHQADLLQNGYQRSGTVIPNPIDLNRKYPRNASPSSILWVGKSDERVKRPSIVLDLAQKFPQIPFTIIMTYAVEETHRECLARGAGLANVTLVERVPYEEVERYFANARVFLNTSSFEGFPNTFLQAGKYGVPLVSLKVDPNEIVSTHGCGLLCDDDIQKLEENIRLIMSDDVLYARLSSRINQYVRQHHDQEVVIPQFEAAFLSFFDEARTGRLNQ